MPFADASIPALLEDRARQQPDDIAFTFYDYEVDPAGFAESLTWSELHHRAQVVAEKLSKLGSPGDRAVVLAPQGLEYLVGFFGAIQAGFIAVPLSVPQQGKHDERVSGAMRDCTPVAVLTTSAIADDIRMYAQEQARQRAPKLIEVDGLDFDSPIKPAPPGALQKVAYLQYTSGSTRSPAGVEVTHHNVMANVDQLLTDMYEAYDETPPADMTVVSWLPYYHDMGLLIGIFAPMVAGRPAVHMSPVAFMQKPARWIRHLAENTGAFTAAPNFAYHVTVRRTSDADLDGVDLSGVAVMINGAERVHGRTVRGFNERFAPFNLPDTAMRPAYGLAEATVYVVSSPGGQPSTSVRFDADRLAAGEAIATEDGSGVEMIGCGAPRSTTVRVVDPETCVQKPDGQIGEIWAHGEHIAAGYWRNPELTARLFDQQLVDPSPGTPAGGWLRTGDLGVIHGGELFIVGRIKDLLIVDGRNHYPDDIESTIQQITGGRVAAISVTDDVSEQLVAIAELKMQLDETLLSSVKQEVTAAVSMYHSVRVADLVLVAQGSLPITTSGKVRRAACAERYRLDEFSRLDVTV